MRQGKSGRIGAKREDMTVAKNRMAWIAVAVFLTGTLSFARPGRADFMTFAFEGVVDDVVDWSYVITEYVHIGDTLSGTVTIDRSVPDSQPTWPNVGEYNGAVVAVQGQVGQMAFSLDTRTTSLVEVVNDAPPLSPSYPGPWDEYKQGADVQTPVVDYALRFAFTLMDISGQAFDEAMGDALPRAMPPIEAFQDWAGDVHGFRLGGGAIIEGHLTVISNVPEPATLTVFVLGGALVAVRRKRRVS